MFFQAIGTYVVWLTPFSFSLVLIFEGQSIIRIFHFHFINNFSLRKDFRQINLITQHLWKISLTNFCVNSDPFAHFICKNEKFSLTEKNNSLVNSLVKHVTFTKILWIKCGEREFLQYPHCVLLHDFDIFPWNQKEWYENECQNWFDEFSCEDAQCGNYRNLPSPKKIRQINYLVISRVNCYFHEIFAKNKWE